MIIAMAVTIVARDGIQGKARRSAGGAGTAAAASAVGAMSGHCPVSSLVTAGQRLGGVTTVGAGPAAGAYARTRLT
jgi:hypothetical protein